MNEYKESRRQSKIIVSCCLIVKFHVHIVVSRNPCFIETMEQ